MSKGGKGGKEERYTLIFQVCDLVIPVDEAIPERRVMGGDLIPVCGHVFRCGTG